MTVKLPDNDYQILKLTDEFYKAYPNPPYIELMKKKGRAYTCLLFQTHYDFFICVPFRTEISHKQAFHFKKSKRSKEHKSGLDYSKIIIITKNEFIDKDDAFVDKDEFNETMVNLNRIKTEALAYVENYIGYHKKQLKLHKREYERRYRYSSLRYFHHELGLE